MGVHGLWKLLLPMGRRVSIETLEGKVLAVDMSIWLTQFIKAMRDDDGRLLKNAHLIGTFRRLCKLLFHKIRPVMVFDGGAPMLKKRTMEKRRKARERQEANYVNAAQRLLMAQIKKKSILVTDKSKVQLDKGFAPGFVPAADAPAAGGGSAGARPDAGAAGKGGGGVVDLCESDEDIDWESEGEPEGQRDQVAVLVPVKNDADSDSEDEQRDREMERVVVPTGDVDPSVLASLPPLMRKQVIEAAHRNQRLRSRQAYISVAGAPDLYSQTQIANFLKHCRLNRKVMTASKMLERNEEAEARRQSAAASARAAPRHVTPVLAKTGETDEELARRLQEEERAQLRASGAAADSGGGAAAGAEGPAAPPASDDGGGSGAEEAKGHDPPADDSSDDGGGGFIIDEEEVPPKEEMASGAAARAERGRDRRAPAAAKGPRSITELLGTGRPLRRMKIPEVRGRLRDGEDPIEALRRKDEERTSEMRETVLSGMRAFFSAEDFKAGQRAAAYPHGDGSGGDASDTSEGESSAFGRVHAAERVQRDRPRDTAGAPSAAGAPQGSSAEGGEVSPARIVATSASSMKQSARRAANDLEVEVVAAPSTKESARSAAQDGEAAAAPGAPGAAPPPLRDGSPAKQRASAEALPPRPPRIPIPPPPEDDEEGLSWEGSSGGAASDDDVVVVEGAAAGASADGGGGGGGGGVEGGVELSILDVLPDALEEEDASGGEGGAKNADAYERAISTASKMANWAGRAVRRALKDHLGPGAARAPGAGATGAAASEGAALEGEDEVQVAGVRPAAEGPAAEMGGGAEEHAPLLLPERTAMSTAERLAEIDRELQSARADRRSAMRDAETVTEEMKVEVMTMLRLFGIPYVVAPSEAEAQCATLEKLGLVNGVITEDSDTFCFGAQTVYKNIFDDKKYVEVYNASDAKKELGISQEDFIALALLLGCDYSDGVRGVGIVNAMEVLRAWPPGELGGAVGALRQFRTWLDEVDADDLRRLARKRTADDPQEEGMDERDLRIREFARAHRGAKTRWTLSPNFPEEPVARAFMFPTVELSAEEFSWALPDADGLRAYCAEELGWPAARTDETLVPVMQRLQDSSTQKRIDSFFYKYDDNSRFAKFRSDRLKRSVASAASPLKGAAAKRRKKAKR